MRRVETENEATTRAQQRTVAYQCFRALESRSDVVRESLERAYRQRQARIGPDVWLRTGCASVACYVHGMNAVRGRVRQGKIEVQAELPEGAEVLILASDGELFDLSDAQIDEIEARMAEADAGQIESAGPVLARLRRDR
jgi:hypothetical protein